MSYSTIVFSTGVNIGIRRVSPMLMLDLRRKFPEPLPPLNEVTLGDDKIMEANPADPDYVRALQNYNADMEEKYRRMIVRRGVNYVLTEADKVEVENVRKDFFDLTGEDLVGTDLEVFIAYIAIGSENDLELLIKAVTGVSQPTEEKIDDHSSNYKSDLPQSPVAEG